MNRKSLSPEVSRRHFSAGLQCDPALFERVGESWVVVRQLERSRRAAAMVEGAVTDFRSLEMVTYANLAEQFLRQ